MKRHASLIQYSHEHHHGLVRAVKLKNAKPEVNHEKLVNSFLEFWETDLVPHFDAEELFLLTALSKYSKDNSLTAEIIVQHRDIRSMIDELRNDKQNIKLMNKLGLALEEHIRYEERLLFPKMEEIIPDDILFSLEKKLKAWSKK